MGNDSRALIKKSSHQLSQIQVEVRSEDNGYEKVSKTILQSNNFLKTLFSKNIVLWQFLSIFLTKISIRLSFTPSMCLRYQVINESLVIGWSPTQLSSKTMFLSCLVFFKKESCFQRVEFPLLKDRKKGRTVEQPISNLRLR